MEKPESKDSTFELLNSTRYMEIQNGLSGLYEDDQFKELADLLPEAVYQADQHGNLIFINRAGRRIFGYSASDFYADFKIWELVIPEEQERLRKHFFHRMNGQNAPREYTALRGDQKTFPAIFYGDAVLDGDRFLGCIGLVADISDRKRIEEALKASKASEAALKESQKRYRYAFEALETPTLLLEADAGIVMVNAAFEELSGYAKHETEGRKTLSAFLDSGDGEILTPSLKNRQTDAPLEHVCEFLNRSGEKSKVIVRLNAVPNTRQFIASIAPEKEAATEMPSNQLPLEKGKNRLHLPAGEDWHQFGDIIGKSRQMQQVYQIILQAAATHANVIIYGESGTGKELVARAIHHMSDRGANRFVPVNCGAIPEGLLESEFFGYKKGAFTGAHADKLGYLDLAHGGSLFLDELGEIGLNIQVKLLRAIEGGEYTPVGTSESKRSDVRIIAATNQDLLALVKQGVVREDFFYRIHILPIHLPPLRERKEDLPLLVDHFKSRYDQNGPPIPDHILKKLQDYDWPGNVRELQNVLHRYFTLKRLDLLGTLQSSREASASPNSRQDGGNKIPRLQTALLDYEKKLLLDALRHYKWHRGKTAAALGVNRKTLFMKMKKFELI